MSNVATYDEDDDGFSHGSRSSRGGYLRWSADGKPTTWRDQDGCTPPSQMVAMYVDERLCRWEDGRPTYLVEKPLPDPDDLNAEIPQSEWEKDLNGDPRPPWEHQAVVGFVDLSSAQKFIFSTATIGGHIAVDELKESVATMRLLRGVKCVPVIELCEKPMKTRFKMSSRPYLKIVDWKTLGGDQSVLPPGSVPPQIEGPREKTLAAMGTVKEPSTAELVDDEIPEL